MSGILPELHKVVTGVASATDTSVKTIIAAPDAGARLCVTSLQLGRSDAGTTAITVTLNDLAPTVLVLPNSGGGGSIPFVFDTPLMFAPATAMTMKASAGVTTLFASAQGFTLE